MLRDKVRLLDKQNQVAGKEKNGASTNVDETKTMLKRESEIRIRVEKELKNAKEESSQLEGQIKILTQKLQEKTEKKKDMVDTEKMNLLSERCSKLTDELEALKSSNGSASASVCAERDAAIAKCTQMQNKHKETLSKFKTVVTKLKSQRLK